MPEDILNTQELANQIQDSSIDQSKEDADVAAAAVAIEEDQLAADSSPRIDLEEPRDEIDPDGFSDIGIPAFDETPMPDSDTINDVMNESLNMDGLETLDTSEELMSFNPGMSDTVDADSTETLSDLFGDVFQDDPASSLNEPLDFGAPENIESPLQDDLSTVQDTASETSDFPDSVSDMDPSQLTLNVIDFTDFANLQIEPDHAYVVTGGDLENPVLIYPDENGNIHYVDSFYAVDGMLISGSDLEPFALDPVTGDVAQPIETVMDYIDARAYDNIDTSYQDMRNDLENTSFESQMDTGVTTEDFLPNDMESIPQADMPEPDPVDYDSMMAQDTGNDDWQDFLPDMAADSHELDRDNLFQDPSEDLFQGQFADVPEQDFGNDFSYDFTNDMEYQDYSGNADYDSGVDGGDYDSWDRSYQED